MLNLNLYIPYTRGIEMNNKYICPFCFSSLNLNDIHYQCVNQSCTRMFIRAIDEGTVDRGRAYRSTNDDEEIDVEKSVFLGKNLDGKDALRTKYHIVRNSSGICDICCRPVHKRLCPVCHNPIPAEAEDEKNKIFVILGPKGSGMSHYTSVLINQLKNSFAQEFNGIVVPASDRTEMKYRKYYFKSLYEGGRKLPSNDERSLKEPMIYYVRFPNKDLPGVTLVFFDATDKGIRLESFISNASGIICLMDPLQIPYVNERLRTNNKPPPSEDIVDVVSEISETIRSAMSLSPNSKIPIPLAMTFTKSDVLMKTPENDEEEKVLFGPGSSLNIPRERGVCDKENFMQIDAEIYEYLKRSTPKKFVDIIDGFENYCFFAVSSLGWNPESTILDRSISSFRVEDPLIWLLGNQDSGEKN